MDYEKAYKEALERARNWANKYVGDWRNGVFNLPYDKTGEIAKDFRNIFPELKESEDVTKLCSNKWSEEDKKVYAFIIDFFENCWWNKNWEISREQVLKLLNELTQQQKVKWSVEDEENLNWCINLVLSQDSLSSEWKKEVLDWLESLRSQPQHPLKKSYDGPWESFSGKKDAAEDYAIQTARYPVKESEYLADLEDAFISGIEWKEKENWKPSKEQMDALEFACTIREGERNYYLHTLFDDLKKL